MQVTDRCREEHRNLRFQLPKHICAACPLQSRCCTGQGGRTIGVSAHYELVQQARARQKTEAFKQDYTSTAMVQKVRSQL